MSSICGQLPRKTRYLKSKSGWQAFGGRVALLIWFSLIATTAGAQHRVPLTLAAAEELALNQEPGQAGMLARAEALEAESVAAGQLPDPMLRVGLANFPLQSGGFTPRV